MAFLTQTLHWRGGGVSFYELKPEMTGSGLEPEHLRSVSGRQHEQPRAEISRRIDGIRAVVAERDADVQHLQTV